MTKPHIYCHVSPEYEPLLDEFVRPQLEKEFDLCVLKTAWSVEMRLDWIAMLLKHEPDFLFFTGCDVLFAKPVYERTLECLKDFDVAAHDTSLGAMCPDYMVLRCTDKVRAWWDRVSKLTLASCCAPTQCAEMEGMRLLSGEVKYTLLPKNEFWVCCNAIPSRGGVTGWRPVEADVPKTARMIHAACVCGLQNKVDVLRLCRQYLAK